MVKNDRMIIAASPDVVPIGKKVAAALKAKFEEIRSSIKNRL